jgi:hypothetical protein
MTPTEYIALFTSIPAIIAAITSLIVAIKSKNTSNTAITALNQHVMTHVVNKRLDTINREVNIVTTPDKPAMTEDVAPELTNPIGLQGSTLMGVVSAAPPVDAVPPVPEPVAETPEDIEPDVLPVPEPAPETPKQTALERARELVEELRHLL